MINRRCFITGIKGKSLTRNEIIFLNKYQPWGVIIFTGTKRGTQPQTKSKERFEP